MLDQIHPKLPMRDKNITRNYYEKLGFEVFGNADYEDYLMLHKDNVQMHFFKFEALNPNENYGQVYIRINDIDSFYKTLVQNGINIHPAGHLQTKPWGQKEFALLDPDNNLLTFGQSI